MLTLKTFLEIMIHLGLDFPLSLEQNVIISFTLFVCQLPLLSAFIIHDTPALMLAAGFLFQTATKLQGSH